MNQPVQLNVALFFLSAHLHPLVVGDLHSMNSDPLHKEWAEPEATN